jgi:hypothetical protein
MRRILSQRDLDSIRIGLDSLRESQSTSHRFYYVLRSEFSTEDNPIEPIFGEPVDVFAAGLEVSETFIPFKASIVEESPDSDYNEAGFVSYSKVVIDVDSDVLDGGHVPFELGGMVMLDGVRLRVVNIDYKGLQTNHRVLISLEKVT